MNALKVYLSEDEQVDIREMLSEIDKKERAQLKAKLEETKYREEEKERYLTLMGHLSDVSKIIYDVQAPEMFK